MAFSRLAALLALSQQTTLGEQQHLASPERSVLLSVGLAQGGGSTPERACPGPVLGEGPSVGARQ